MLNLAPTHLSAKVSDARSARTMESKAARKSSLRRADRERPADSVPMLPTWSETHLETTGALQWLDLLRSRRADWRQSH